MAKDKINLDDLPDPSPTPTPEPRKDLIDLDALADPSAPGQGLDKAAVAAYVSGAPLPEKPGPANPMNGKAITSTITANQSNPEITDAPSLGMEVSKAVSTGSRDFLKNTAGALADSAEYLKEKVTGDGKDGAPFFRGIEKSLSDIPLNEPETGGGRLLKGAVQFTEGMVGISKLVPFLPKTAAGKFILTSAEGGAAQAVAFDPLEARMSNWIEEFPTLQNPVTEYLSAQPDDSKAEGRFKNFVEGMGLGLATDGLLKAFATFRQVRTLRASGKDAEALEVLAKAGDEIPAKAPEKPSEALSQPKVTPEPPKAPEVSTDLNQAVKDYVTERLASNPENLSLGAKPSNIFNTVKLNQGNEVLNVLNLMSDAYAPEIAKATGGVRTLEATKDLAKILGENPAELMLALRQGAKDASKLDGRIVAGKQLMVDLASRISEEAKLVNLGKSADQLSTMRDALSELVVNLKANQTAAARATSAGRIKINPANPEDAQLLRFLSAMDGDAAKIVKLLQPEGIGSKIIRTVASLRIGMMLSDVVSHGRNIVGGAIKTALMPMERINGGMIMRDWGSVREGLSLYAGLVRSSADAVKLMAKSLWMDEGILHGGAKFPKPVAPEYWGLDPKSYSGQVVSGVGKVTNLSQRFLVAEDEFFQQLNYRASVYARATREGLDKGLKGDALSKHIAKVEEEAFTKEALSPDGAVEQRGGIGVDEESLRYAKSSVFQQDLGPFGSKIETVLSHHPAAKLFIPFYKTPVNLLGDVLERAPGGLSYLSHRFRADLEAGGARKADAMGKLVTGGALTATAMALAMNGGLTGKGPSRKEERDALLATGWQPYSIKIGDKYYSQSAFEPYSTYFGVVADMAEAGASMDQKDHDAVASAVVLSVANNLTNKTWTRGLADLVDTLSSDNQNKIDRVLQSYASSFVPRAPQQIASAFDDNAVGDSMHDVRSMSDAMLNKLPYYNQMLPVKRDMFGEPVPLKAALGPDRLSPFAYTVDVKDETKSELARLTVNAKDSLTPLLPIHGNVDFRQIPAKDGDGSAFDRLGEILRTTRIGRDNLKQAMDHLIESKDYQALPEDTSADYESARMQRVKAVLGAYRQAAINRLMEAEPDVKKAILMDRQNKMQFKQNGSVQDIQAFLKSLNP